MASEVIRIIYFECNYNKSLHCLTVLLEFPDSPENFKVGGGIVKALSPGLWKYKGREFKEVFKLIKINFFSLEILI